MAYKKGENLPKICFPIRAKFPAHHNMFCVTVNTVIWPVSITQLWLCKIVNYPLRFSRVKVFPLAFCSLGEQEALTTIRDSSRQALYCTVLYCTVLYCNVLYVQHNSEMNSYNCRCSGKAITEFVFVVLDMQHAMRIRHIVICSLSASTLSHKRRLFFRKSYRT